MSPLSMSHELGRSLPSAVATVAAKSAKIAARPFIIVRVGKL